jgi:hypothetical protein
MKKERDQMVVRLVTVDALPGDVGVVLGLAEGADGSGRSLIIQSGGHYDEQDAAAGMNIYSVSNEMGATTYGGVREHQLQRGSLSLRLDPRAADVLGLPTKLRLRLHVDTETLRRLEDALAQVFEPN